MVDMSTLSAGMQSIKGVKDAVAVVCVIPKGTGHQLVRVWSGRPL